MMDGASCLRGNEESLLFGIAFILKSYLNNYRNDQAGSGKIFQIFYFSCIIYYHNIVYNIGPSFCGTLWCSLL